MLKNLNLHSILGLMIIKDGSNFQKHLLQFQYIFYKQEVLDSPHCLYILDYIQDIQDLLNYENFEYFHQNN